MAYLMLKYKQRANHNGAHCVSNRSGGTSPPQNKGVLNMYTNQYKIKLNGEIRRVRRRR